MKACPHCGAVLPDEASFCPGCARSVILREKFRRCPRLPIKAVFGLLAALALALLAALVWRFVPRTYDSGTAEALYTLNGQTYQLCVAWANTPTEPTGDRYTSSAIDFDGRYPSLLYINRADTGVNAADEFLP